MIEYLNEPYEIIEKPLAWQLLGLQQTSSGYGLKLTSSRCVKFINGSIRRIYITQISNVGSAWIMLKNKKLFLKEI